MKEKVGALKCELANGKKISVGTGYLNSCITTIRIPPPLDYFLISTSYESVYPLNRFTDSDRSDAPPIGSIITFRYQELTSKGIPRFPSFIGVRSDILWPPGKEQINR